MLRITLFVCCLFISILPVSAQRSKTLVEAPINWLTFEQALNKASGNGRPVLVDVYAVWCSWCAKSQTEVYTVETIQDYLAANFEISRLDIEKSDDAVSFKGFTLTSAELAAGLGAEATPTTVFLDSDGGYITRLPGYVDAEEFMHILRFIGSEAYRIESSKDFRARQ